MDRVKCLVRVFDGRENESFCCGKLKVFLVYCRPTGSVPWTLFQLSSSFELLKSAFMEELIPI